MLLRRPERFLQDGNIYDGLVGEVDLQFGRTYGLNLHRLYCGSIIRVRRNIWIHFSILRCFHCPLLDYPPVFSILISPTLGCFYQVWRGWSCRFHVQKWTVRLLLSRLSILRVLSGSYRTSTKFEAWNSSSRQPETRRDLSQHCTFRLHTAGEVSWRTWVS